MFIHKIANVIELISKRNSFCIYLTQYADHDTMEMGADTSVMVIV